MPPIDGDEAKQALGVLLAGFRAGLGWAPGLPGTSRAGHRSGRGRSSSRVKSAVVLRRPSSRGRHSMSRYRLPEIGSRAWR